MSCVATTERAELMVPRLSVPRRGQVLSTVTEQYGGPVRFAIEALTSALSHSEWDARTQKAISSQSFGTVQRRSDAEMVARHACAQWVVGFALSRFSETTGLVASLRWFDLNNPLLPAIQSLDTLVLSETLEHLIRVAEPAALADLLPYILDPHGPGSRLSVMRDPNTGAARASRRSSGVFYTPADVAEYMVQAALTDTGIEDKPKILDLACGTGVFLRAALGRLQTLGMRADFAAQNCLFGVDIDPWSVDGAAYVLLHDVLCECPSSATDPSVLWRSIRNNLAIADALCIDPAGTLPRRSLFKSEPSRFSLKEVFPALIEGPDVVVGNPPYAPIGERSDLVELAHVFATLPGKGSGVGDLHPLFFEQMMRLAQSSASGALVIPLSVAFSSGQQYAAMRQLVEHTAGTWKFSFFDREPHALFGEDVKTRNTIVTWKRTTNDMKSRKLTGPLMKWRGHDRARMLRGIQHTELHSSIVTGIPKLSSKLQSEVLDSLLAGRSSMSKLAISFRSTSLEHTFDADRKTLFVGGTAYNFLNVLFRPHIRYRQKDGMMSTNTMHALSFLTVRDALAAFALLSSGLSFWLWHIQGDGFHLSRSFLESFPLGPDLFDPASFEQLAHIGLGLWCGLQAHPVESLNRGRASLSFPASRLRRQQRLADSLIIKALGLPTIFVDELDSFINSVVSALPSTVAPTEALEEVLAI